MAQLIQMPLWVKIDEHDKPADQPNGAWYLNGQLEVSGVDVVLKAGQKLGLAIRRNKNRQNDKAPDYYGELYVMTERADRPEGSR